MKGKVVSLYTVGDWHPADSYGKIAIQLARYLSSQGIRANCISLGQTVLDEQSIEVRAITDQEIVPSSGGICMGWPTHYAKFGATFHSGPRVAITMFESSILPDSWAPILNDFDAVVVPSRFCVDIFKQGGVTVPIHMIPLGVGDEYRYRARPANFHEGRPLTFLAFVDRGERKGAVVALQAFLRAFGDDPRYKLILKSRVLPVGFEFTNSNIEAIQGDYNQEELVNLYTRCDVLINPHKGEGFGLLPREFAATGGLALTTAWSGTADCLSLWGMGIPYTLEPAGWQGNAGLAGLPVGDWAHVDTDQLASQLRQVAAEWPNHLRKAESRARMVHRLYSWQDFARRVYAVWKEVAYGHDRRLSVAASGCWAGGG